MSQPKKSLGQHWLHDESILQSITDSAELTSQDHVLEIGPGLGTLTDFLVQTGATVTALEFDDELVPSLVKKFRSNSNVSVVHGDVRRFDLTSLPKSYKVVANIPYYLTSHLVRQLAESTNRPKTAVLLIQKEVAERICAKPGEMSLLSIVAQWYFDCSLGVHVPAKLFTPPPKVDSQVVVLASKVSQELPDQKLFWRIVKAGFAERRKTLANSLSAGLQIPKAETESTLKSIGIEPTRRAQTLSLDEWLQLYKTYASEQV